MNCVSVQAIGSGRAFTSPTFFHKLVLGNDDPSWYAYNWYEAISACDTFKDMFQDNTIPLETLEILRAGLGGSAFLPTSAASLYEGCGGNGAGCFKTDGGGKTVFTLRFDCTVLVGIGRL